MSFNNNSEWCAHARVQYDNLGLSIADLMPEGRVGKYMPSFVHVPTDTGISSTHLSVVLAWVRIVLFPSSGVVVNSFVVCCNSCAQVTTEMAEPIRLPLVLALSPLVRKALDRRRAAAGEK